MYHRGFHGDLNETFLVGNVSDVGKKLTKVTWECLQKAIEAGMNLFPIIIINFLAVNFFKFYI